MEGSCEDQVLHLVVPIVLNLLSDLIILGLPIIGLWGLQMQKQTKVGIFFAFSVGSFICGIDCIRLYQCFSTENDGDTTWDNAGSIVWSAIEVSLAVFVACIPTWAPLLALMRGRRLKSRPAGASGIYDDNTNQFMERGGSSHFGSSRFQTLSGNSKESHIYKGSEVGHAQQARAFHLPLRSPTERGMRSDNDDDDIPLQGIVVSREVEISRENMKDDQSE